jgi:hypothetical protein
MVDVPLIDTRARLRSPSASAGILAVWAGLAHVVSAAFLHSDALVIVDVGYVHVITLAPSGGQIARAEAFWWSRVGPIGVPFSCSELG